MPGSAEEYPDEDTISGPRDGKRSSESGTHECEIPRGHFREAIRLQSTKFYRVRAIRAIQAGTVLLVRADGSSDRSERAFRRSRRGVGRLADP